MSGRSYLAEIEEFFVGVVRRGLVLRASDVEVIRDWEARGVPVEVVKRGIVEGVSRFLRSAEPSEPLPSSLRYYRAFVETLFEAHLRSLGLGRRFERGKKAYKDLVEVGLEVLRERAQRSSREAERRRYEEAQRRLREEAAVRSASEALSVVEEWLINKALEEAPEEVRERIVGEVSACVAEARRRGLGEAVVRDLERAEKARAVAEGLGVKGVVEEVLRRA